jgi:hypothetical protein
VAGSLEETRDLHLDGDFLPEMPEVTGRTALVQRLIRRLTTQPGVLPCWQNQGINGSGLRIDVFIRSAEGPFTFTMGVTEAAATLIALQEAA